MLFTLKNSKILQKLANNNSRKTFLEFSIAQYFIVYLKWGSVIALRYIVSDTQPASDINASYFDGRLF